MCVQKLKEETAIEAKIRETEVAIKKTEELLRQYREFVKKLKQELGQS